MLTVATGKQLLLKKMKKFCAQDFAGSDAGVIEIQL
jgi:hypothetical protein